MRELLGGGRIVRIERERLARRALGVRPARELQVRLRLRGEGGVGIRRKLERGLRSRERLLRPLEHAEDEGAQDVVIDLVRLDRDGVVDGRERVAMAVPLVKLAGREMVQRERVVGHLRERFAKGVFRIGVAADFLELKAAEDLRGKSAGVHAEK